MSSLATWSINSSTALRATTARLSTPTDNPAFSASNVYHIGGLPAGQAADAFPAVTFAGVDAPTNWAGYTANAGISNSYTLIDNVQWIKGKHSITIGADFAWIQYNYNTALGGSTPYTLTTAVTETAGFTSTSSSPTPSTGVAYASFLIDQIDKATLPRTPSRRLADASVPSRPTSRTIGKSTAAYPGPRATIRLLPHLHGSPQCAELLRSHADQSRNRFAGRPAVCRHRHRHLQLQNQRQQLL